MIRLIPLMLWSATAQAAPDIGFPGLQTQALESPCAAGIRVHFDPTLAEGRADYTAIEEHPAGGETLLLVGRIDRSKPDRYRVIYDDGPSCDPTFTVYRDGASEPLGSFGGEQLIVPGNGYLYVIRRSNRSYEGREKWEIRDGALVEVAQPLRYVGLPSRTLKAISLRQTQAEGATVLAQVPAGETVTIVAHQEDSDSGRDWYLVRTRFGLLGWISDSGYGEERQFEALQFMGD